MRQPHVYAYTFNSQPQKHGDIIGHADPLGLVLGLGLGLVVGLGLILRSELMVAPHTRRSVLIDSDSDY